jgi:Single-strand binding protein family
MTEAAISFAGNLTDDPQVRYTESGVARAMFRVAVSGRREQEASFFIVIVWRTRLSMPASRSRRAAGSWSWADSSRKRRVSWPRSRARACDGRRPPRPG